MYATYAPAASSAGRPSVERLRNVESGAKCAILYTIVENCRRLGIDTREYLEDVLTRLPAMKASEAAGLTPARWLAARTAKVVRQAV